MARKIFIWLAHPKRGSFCESLADAYAAGAKAHGAEVRRLNLADMSFAVDEPGYGGLPLEPDLRAFQDAIIWADHIFVVHPYWWGAMPAKAKAVLDRTFEPGFALKWTKPGRSWDKLLAGRTGDAIITSDTPPLIDTLIYHRPGRRVLRNQVLEFCGIKLKTVRQFGSIIRSTPERREKWLNQAHSMGATAA